MKKNIYFILIFMNIFITLLSTTSLSYINVPTWTDESIEANADLTETSSDTVNISLNSESAILIEANTGKILFEKDCHKQLRPASVTKIMSILLIMEALERNQITLETQVPCSEKASSMGGSQIWLDPTETLSVNEMLKAICIVSANDCTVAMAEFLSGSEELFVEKMNSRAKELGMNDTSFKNCHGIDEDNHFTSSYDIALMSKELIVKHPQITKYTTIWMDTLRNGTSQLNNTNKLVKTYEGATGLKTGSTSLALYNLSASATRNNLSLIAVVMRAPTPKDRFNETKLLLDYGFSNYECTTLIKSNEEIRDIPIEKGIKNYTNLITENSCEYLKKKNEKIEINSETTINTITAPISKGDILGKINYYDQNNNIIASTNLIASESILKKGFYSNLFSILKKMTSFMGKE